MLSVARSATNSDVFNAIAEGQRRRIISLLAQGEMSVNDIVQALNMRQPQVSKHLRVLREVGIVNVRGEGQQRLYSLNAGALKPLHDWVAPFEQMWQARLNRLDDYLTELQDKEKKHVKQKRK
jgi:DNA-binding transcriptional ArsR family regulator